MPFLLEAKIYKARNHFFKESLVFSNILPNNFLNLIKVKINSNTEMLTPQTLKELQNKQKELDEFIVKSKNLTDTDSKKSFIRTKIALLVEIGELANELATFKH